MLGNNIVIETTEQLVDIEKHALEEHTILNKEVQKSTISFIEFYHRVSKQS